MSAALLWSLAVAWAAPTWGDPEPLGHGLTLVRGADPDVPALAVAVQIDASAVAQWKGTPSREVPDTDTQSDHETLAQRTTDFLVEHGLDLAVNANFFSPCCSYLDREPTKVLGLSMDDGEVVSAPQNGFAAAFVVSEDGVPALIEAKAGHDTSGLRVAVAGQPWLIQDGTVVAPDAPREPRTAIGLDAAGHTVTLLIVDGRNVGTSEGATFVELAAWLQGLGVHTAMNLDGGGSSTLAVPGDPRPTILNTPSTGGLERLVANHLGVVMAPAPDPVDTDPNPADTDPADAEEPPTASGCGCTHRGPTAPHGLAPLALVGVVWRRRRAAPPAGGRSRAPAITLRPSGS